MLVLQSLAMRIPGDALERIASPRRNSRAKFLIYLRIPLDSLACG
jgi:hypothetical protein